MRLKRLYDHDAPEKEWVTREEPCPTCNAKGVIINETLDGVERCPDCEEGVRKRLVPPVSGIKVLYAGAEQHFSPRIIQVGQQEGWLKLAGKEVVISGEDGAVVYEVVRTPGHYDGERINYYDCKLKE